MLKWFWEEISYGIPIYTIALLIPSPFSTWWRNNITPYLLTILMLWGVGYLIIKLVKLLLRKPKENIAKQEPTESYVKNIQDNTLLHISNELIISDSIKCLKWSTIKTSNMIPGAYKFIFNLEEEDGSYLIDQISIVHLKNLDRFINQGYDDKHEKFLIVDAGEVLLFSGSLVDDFENDKNVLSRKLTASRKLMNNQFITIPTSQEKPEGFIALPIYGDGEYKVNYFLALDKVFAISININVIEEI